MAMISSGMEAVRMHLWGDCKALRPWGLGCRSPCFRLERVRGFARGEVPVATIRMLLRCPSGKLDSESVGQNQIGLSNCKHSYGKNEMKWEKAAAPSGWPVAAANQISRCNSTSVKLSAPCRASAGPCNLTMRYTSVYCSSLSLVYCSLLVLD